MLGRGLCRISRVSARVNRHQTLPAKPLLNVKDRPPVQQEAAPILEPVYLSLTPSLKRARHDPPAEKNIAILEPTVFRHPIRRDILHLCVVHYRDSLRQGSANTKTRGEVRGSGAKIRRQKGSGKARLGDAQSPMLRGGGVAFGPKPRDFSTKLPRKVIEMGMRVALSSKLNEHKLGVMMRLYWPNGKTKFLARKIDQLGLRKTLFITGHLHKGLEQAIRNIPMVKLITIEEANVYEILKWERVVLDLKAVEYFEQKLKKENVPIVPLSLLPSEASVASEETTLPLQA
ncbi:ribosomal protein L4/L1 family-domain-containing protein [Gymnopilus junonius]|uniref:Large ribosomal subunit protein uL4m n=1 Tax=Gymnopilus junonius TaxID=109634 RepID=A0A9P5TRD3_GYMJU|nr:ribosomal protein L4/L1 family-domain-containing protein [Gymnopilus junonius]